MTKLVLYRNNTAYEQFLAPAIAARGDIEVQVFPVDTDKTDIRNWIADHADHICSMEMVYLDQTCYEAGKKFPSATRAGNNCHIWMDVKTNYGGFDSDFREAAEKTLTKSSVDETISAIVSLMLKKSNPTEVYVIKEHMGDHDLYGSLSTHHDWKRAAKEDAEKLRACLEKVIGKSVTIIDEPSEFDGDHNSWVFFDRHSKDSPHYAKDTPSAHWFRLPIENLIADAVAFGIELDVEAYAEAIREIVAKW